jgi:hypothetical protein
MKQPEYIEGPQARENFERGMKALFHVSKKQVEIRKKRQQQRKATARKKKPSDGGKV